MLRSMLVDLYDDQMVFMDGYDDCIAGVCERLGMLPIVAYDRDKVIKKLVVVHGMTYEDAEEWHGFNQLGSWVGDRSPCFLTDPTACFLTPG